MLLALILNDWVFEKYGYEEEDFMKNVGEQAIQTNPGLIQLFRDMELAIIKLMQKLEIIPEDVGKYMEQTAQQRGQMPQQLPQQMPNMGMMPGSNPMDLLQMQQMQQMQQMFQNMQPKWVCGDGFVQIYYIHMSFVGGVEGLVFFRDWLLFMDLDEKIKKKSGLLVLVEHLEEFLFLLCWESPYEPGPFFRRKPFS